MENAPLTEREEQRLRKGWEAIAGGEEEPVSVDALKEALEKAGFEPDSEACGKVLARVDPDETGEITWENFRAAITLLGKKLLIILSIRSLFDRMDTDKDDRITLDNLKEIAAELNISDVADDERLEELFNKMDEAGEGDVDFKGFLIGLADFIRANFPDDFTV